MLSDFYWKAMRHARTATRQENVLVIWQYAYVVCVHDIEIMLID